MASFSDTVRTEPEQFVPMKHQVDAIKLGLSTLAAGFFFKPGLGKTSTTLSIFKLLKEAGQVDKMFIIAPIHVCHNVWPDEITKWADFKHLTHTVLHGNKKNDRLKEVGDVDIVLTNPHSLNWLYKNLNKLDLKDSRYMLVIDESSYFRNSSSQRFKLLKKFLHLFPRRYILTGTPTPNGLKNIWAQIFILDQGKRLGQFFSKFRREFFSVDEYNQYSLEVKPGADQVIYNRIRPIAIYRAPDEMNLPELIIQDIVVDLPPEARKVYDDMKRFFIAEYKDETIVSVNAGSQSMKLLQIASGGIYIEKDGKRQSMVVHKEKVEAVKNLKEEFYDSPIMVSYMYKHDLEKLREIWPDAPNLGAGTSAKQATQIIKDWNNNLIPVLFIHPQAAAHGLNMQFSDCRTLVWFSLTTDLELYEQLIKRIHRRGIKHTLFVYRILANNTYDMRTPDILAGKDTIQTALLKELY